MTLALMASAVSRYGSICRRLPRWRPRRKPGARPARTAPAFAVSQLNFPGKTETYEILRHPEGGRKDVFRWSGIGGTPVAELEIYRPGEEIDQVGSAAGYLAATDGPGRPARAGSRGNHRQQVRPRHPVSPDRRHRSRPRLPAILQACRGAEIPSLRLVMPGRGFAGPARGDRLHAEPADSADGRQTMPNWRNCSPMPRSGAAIARHRARRPCRRIG